jgi:hypothetical protein
MIVAPSNARLIAAENILTSQYWGIRKVFILAIPLLGEQKPL